ncbi:DUF2625 family protein, partial [Escherichia coli]|nr:DUF2625 family protein [Escherichia coli]
SRKFAARAEWQPIILSVALPPGLVRQWALSGDLDTFYENVRWQQWREDVGAIFRCRIDVQREQGGRG